MNRTLSSRVVLTLNSLTKASQHAKRTLSSKTERQCSTSFSRKYSTESDSDSIFDYGDYQIVLPPENAPSGVAHFKLNDVPTHIRRPRYAQPSTDHSILPKETLSTPIKNATSRLKLGSDEELRMRRACKLAKDTLNYAGSLVKPGVTPEQIDNAVHRFITSNNAYPSPLKYEGFPKSICTSVNNIISHGIPDSRRLEDGDIMNIDITVYLDAFHGDTSRTFAIGNVDRKGAHLLKTSQEALRVGIAACGPGKPFRAIGHAIHSFIHGSTKPESTGSYTTRPQCDDVVYSICSAFTGHGIGSKFHMRPWIIHTKNEEPEVMAPGDCFTIEPIILQTSREDETSIWLWNDGWTASTDNGARGAVFEHTVLITEDGVDILTG